MRRTHGLSRTPAWKCWWDMLRRCRDPKCRNYSKYGARGIRVCARWLLFENFLEDMGQPPTGMQLNRINNDGNYDPNNCCWATRLEQMRNTRMNRYIDVDGQRLTMSEAARKLGLTFTGLKHRINAWGYERAVSEPIVPRVERGRRSAKSRTDLTRNSLGQFKRRPL